MELRKLDDSAGESSKPRVGQESRRGLGVEIVGTVDDEGGGRE